MRNIDKKFSDYIPDNKMLAVCQQRASKFVPQFRSRFHSRSTVTALTLISVDGLPT